VTPSGGATSLDRADSTVSRPAAGRQLRAPLRVRSAASRRTRTPSSELDLPQLHERHLPRRRQRRPADTVDRRPRRRQHDDDADGLARGRAGVGELPVRGIREPVLRSVGGGRGQDVARDEDGGVRLEWQRADRTAASRPSARSSARPVWRSASRFASSRRLALLLPACEGALDRRKPLDDLEQRRRRRRLGHRVLPAPLAGARRQDPPAARALVRPGACTAWAISARRPRSGPAAGRRAAPPHPRPSDAIRGRPCGHWSGRRVRWVERRFASIR